MWISLLKASTHAGCGLFLKNLNMCAITCHRVRYYVPPCALLRATVCAITCPPCALLRAFSVLERNFSDQVPRLA